MRTFDQRWENISGKIDDLKQKKKLRKRIIGFGSLGVAALALALFLFLPFRTTPPDVSRYADSPYFQLIQRINTATFRRPAYQNNWQMIIDGLIPDRKGDLMYAPGNAAEAGASSQSYQEVTDNQVFGVTEGDRFKRSDRYVYYLRDGSLSVYSIEGAGSRELNRFALDQDGYRFWYDEAQIYLSEDCRVLTLVRSCYYEGESYVRVDSLDVTDPLNIQITASVCMTGSYLSSRMADGKLLLTGKFYIQSKPDFSDESTFLPQIGMPGNMTSVAAEDILCADQITNTRYTVVSMLEEKSLRQLSSAAFLSYSDDIFVSGDHLYAMCTYSASQEDSRKVTTTAMTRISCMEYSSGKLIRKGGIDVKGTVKNQYSMDEKDGILRVVTTTSGTVSEKSMRNGEETMSVANIQRNVSLYCIRIRDWTVIGAAENFAPQGESAESVRFDGDMAYVCTAQVVLLTDPVYYFDLSDPQAITSKDTGTIEGYSTSLVQLGDGLLMGIGYSDSRGLKIEIYRETQTGVESLCSYEKPEAVFSEEYKSYYIDRENRMVGLGCFEGGRLYYMLLMFDGYELREIVHEEMSGDPKYMRAFAEDGWLYILSEDLKPVSIG